MVSKKKKEIKQVEKYDYKDIIVHHIFDENVLISLKTNENNSKFKIELENILNLPKKELRKKSKY